MSLLCQRSESSGNNVRRDAIVLHLNLVHAHTPPSDRERRHLRWPATYFAITRGLRGLSSSRYSTCLRRARGAIAFATVASSATVAGQSPRSPSLSNARAQNISRTSLNVDLLISSQDDIVLTNEVDEKTLLGRL